MRKFNSHGYLIVLGSSIVLHQEHVYVSEFKGQFCVLRPKESVNIYDLCLNHIVLLLLARGVVYLCEKCVVFAVL